MFADVALVPQEIEHMPLERFSGVAVIDVLRATTTIATALANGARGVVPVATPEEALAWRSAGTGVLLGGERGARRIPGFDLGNSPFEYSAERVAGRLIVLTTTNGTLAFRRVLAAASGRSPELIAACLRNASACARHLWERATAAGGDVLLVCAGTNGWFSLEDAFCAAVLLRDMAELGSIEYGDGARAAVRLGAGAGDAFEELSQSRHGRRLLDLGFHEDIAYCAERSVCTAVPRLEAGVLVNAGGSLEPDGTAGAVHGRGE